MSETVFVAMSGGVDSTVTAHLLLQEGYRVHGVFMETRTPLGATHGGAACESTRADDARQSARQLGIPFDVVDLSTQFDCIVEHFCLEYRAGRTPNPCTLCNPQIKFGCLYDFAMAHGADRFATGHYARIVTQSDGTRALCRGVDPTKDQSYALFAVERARLECIMFPLGDRVKADIRALAAKLGLSAAERPESQDICFVDQGSYVQLLQQRMADVVRPGPIVDVGGKHLGDHAGTVFFTIGQRRGVRVPMGIPYYVVRIEAETNTVVVGPAEALDASHLLATNANWLADPPKEPFMVQVQVRYRSKAAPCIVTPKDFDNSGVARSFAVAFDRPVRAITPGQAAVIYRGDRVVGGGWIA